MLTPLRNWFWQDQYWLPPGFTWEDMKETGETRYPQPWHLLLSIPFALVMVGFRIVIERAVAVPLSRKMGLKERACRKASPNPTLEAFYTRHRKSPSKEEIQNLAKRSDLQPRQVERWFRFRHNQDRPSLTKKFCEASWRFVFYFTSFVTGITVLYDKPWFWDNRACWAGYPQQPLLYSVFAYYMLQLSFYSSLVITLPFDVKRKDFHEQIVHHAVTIFLITFSYCANYLRIGTLVIFIHDIADCILELTKLFNYLKWRWICDTLFLLFSCMFLFTRLVVFPYKVLYNTYYYSMELYQPFFGYYLMNALLMILQLLHVFWSCLIVHMVLRFFKCGTMERDLRSDSEESDTEEAHGGPGKGNAAPPLLNGNSNCIDKDPSLQLNGRNLPAR